MPSPQEQRRLNTTRKKPSIERFLGSFHEQFMYDADSNTSHGPSSQSPGTDSGLPSVSNPTPDEAGEGPRGSSSTAPTAAPSDVIKRFPKLQYPIRIFHGDPPPFSLALQRRKMRWRYLWFHEQMPHCIQNPDVRCIQETVRPYIKSLAPQASAIAVEPLWHGGFNQAYNVTAKDVATGCQTEYIFRVSLPIWPYYKVESDVATTEFVRHATRIPVPIIYAFDSNSNNRLGFEWMLMEKVQGTPLNEVWKTMEFKKKQDCTKKIASWMAELS